MHLGAYDRMILMVFYLESKYGKDWADPVTSTLNYLSLIHIFRYGAMNSGKSTALMQVAHNYEEQGMKVLILKPQVDTKEMCIRDRAGIHGTGGVQHGVGHVLFALVHHVFDVQTRFGGQGSDLADHARFVLCLLYTSSG